MATEKLELTADSYEKHQQLLWVWDNNDGMVKKTFSYVPFVYRIFDQILLDVAGKLKSLKVNIDPDNNCISVYHNGVVYGYGAKLAHILSTEFTIETAVGNTISKQVYTNNIRNSLESLVTKCNDDGNWTRLSFKPDLSRFRMGCLEHDVVTLMKKRVIDLAGCLGKKVQVQLDGKPVSFTTFEDYVSLYLQPDAPRLYEKVNDRLEICVSVGDGLFEQVSFVNCCISTIKRVPHVDYIRNQIADRLLKKKKEYRCLKEYNLKRYLWVFVNARIDNPTFESLNKEASTSKQSSFRSTCELSPDFLEKVAKSELAERAIFTAACEPDLEIAIPSMLDGLNSCQRNILFYAFKKLIFEEVNVTEFCTYIRYNSAYPYDPDLQETTTMGMALNHPGSNNINLLCQRGPLNPRRMGWKDPGRAEFIDTRLSPITRYIFHEADELVLNFLNERGRSVEPTWYIPIIPMVLVNGCKGEGAEGSTFVPSYNPHDIIANIKRLLDGKEMVPMLPWYKGFNGRIEKTASGYTTTGVVVEEKDGISLRITELPLGYAIGEYVCFLSKQAFIEGFECVDNSNFPSVDIKVIMKNASAISQAKQEGLESKFKLTGTLSTTTDIHLFDPEGVIKKYDSPQQILQDFFLLRLEYYGRRKEAQLIKLPQDIEILENQLRYISLSLYEVRKLGSAELKARNFKEFSTEAALSAGAFTGPSERFVPSSDVGYDYLLRCVTVRAFVDNEVRSRLQNEVDKKKTELADVSKMDSKQLWLRDLEALTRQLDGKDVSEEDNEIPSLVDGQNLQDGEMVKLEDQLEVYETEPPTKKAKVTVDSVKEDVFAIAFPLIKEYMEEDEAISSQQKSGMKTFLTLL